MPKLIPENEERNEKAELFLGIANLFGLVFNEFFGDSFRI